jgi:hypothetical protein
MMQVRPNQIMLSYNKWSQQGHHDYKLILPEMLIQGNIQLYLLSETEERKSTYVQTDRQYNIIPSNCLTSHTPDMQTK